MGYQISLSKLESEAKAYLERDRLPEQRMKPLCHVVEAPRPMSYPEWPGDRHKEPVGIERNPFLRQSWNLTLAALILSDPARQQEAYDKLIEAGTLPHKAVELLQGIHGENLSLHQGT